MLSNFHLRLGLLLPLIVLATACRTSQGPLKVEEGETAPDFTLQSAEGPPVSLTDYRGDRAVLLYFSMGPG